MDFWRRIVDPSSGRWFFFEFFDSTLRARDLTPHLPPPLEGECRPLARGEWGDLPDGLGGAYWFHRRSARDGGGYAGRGFGGFSS